MQVFYTVRPGDFLSKIAERWRIPLNSLVFANNLIAPFTIYPGQQLSMPPGVTTYVVKPGDTIYKISQYYGIPIKVILETNGIAAVDKIMAGQVLKIPEGIAVYVVRPGDTLYKIAARFNVTVNGIPRPDLIIAANEGTTAEIYPGMALSIPYPPPGNVGLLATLLSDGFNSYIGIYDPISGDLNTMPVENADSASNIFWSPDKRKIVYTDSNGVISVVDISTKNIIKIDQVIPPAFADWSYDSSKIIYSNGKVIRYYDVIKHTFRDINRQGASYVQWFPNGTEILYEAKDNSGNSQLYTSSSSGSNERKLTQNTEFPLNNVRLSPNGKYVLFTTPGASISEIYTLELVTGKMARIPGGPEAKNYYPVWSPDSLKIAYSSTQFINGRYYSLIRVSGLKGEGDTTLSIASCYATPVTWSSDSRLIAYFSACTEDKPAVEVWSIEVRRPFQVNLLSGFNFFNLDWF